MQQLCYNEGMTPAGYITTKEAAVLLKVSPRRVIALIKAKKLEAERFGDRAWIIPIESAERLRAERIERGIQEANST